MPDQDTQDPEPQELLRVEGVVKHYPGVVALGGVSLDVRAGEIHALLGENGAGKSTLIGVLSGITQPTSGQVFVDGAPVQLRRPRDAQDLGITTIHQELSLAPDLTVLQNIFLGRELRRGPFGRGLLDERAMSNRVQDVIADFGLTERDLRRPVGEFGALTQHVVEIVKALAFDARLVILDEPTSGLAEEERVALFDHMRRLRERGISIVWVTHRLDELYGLADRITVLRDGRTVARTDTDESTPEDLVRLMVGRKATSLGAVAEDRTAAERPAGPAGSPVEVLRLENVSRRPVLHDVSLTISSGEILGIAGVAGAGRTELARVILGADRIDGGQISVDGKPVRIRHPRDAYRLGIAMVPEERKTLGILADFPLDKNTTVSRLGKVARLGMMLDRRRERAVTRDYIDELGVRTSSASERIRNLSGGNQQKIVIARCLFTGPRLIIFDEPTQGIDVAAKAEVYRLIHRFVAGGGAALVISSEIPELLHVSDRILVMREGAIAGEVRPDLRGDDLEADERASAEIMSLAARSVA
ncbi:sugar ABC transporter ATP-binding protein [Pseudonocardia bannensis]|uniref:Sugar ABC transporter ATP-binding protein n=1 Tax=Pseudonocardia bannensis TaxID=630973 RepID=A0A848DND5_9PSEU|nr:sugar ABC transporter ATP-binding protein [Pseudonocardia bannensis]NMH94039.1 sugar ABC transporter ATP-binding protein [Pseudonocardia bannensis]